MGHALTAEHSIAHCCGKFIVSRQILGTAVTAEIHLLNLLQACSCQNGINVIQLSILPAPATPLGKVIIQACRVNSMQHTTDQGISYRSVQSFSAMCECPAGVLLPACECGV
jgi:hypothetical protein